MRLQADNQMHPRSKTGFLPEGTGSGGATQGAGLAADDQPLVTEHSEPQVTEHSEPQP